MTWLNRQYMPDLKACSECGTLHIPEGIAQVSVMPSGPVWKCKDKKFCEGVKNDRLAKRV